MAVFEKSTVTELVPFPATMVAPAGNVQTYSSAFVTSGTEKTIPVSP